MDKRQLSYWLLAGFAAVMVIWLMLDDPETRQTQLLNLGATQQARRPVQLFPEVADPAHITGMEVLDVTGSTGILVMRDEQGMWYAPDIPGTQTRIEPDAINQSLVEDAATAITLLAAEQTYEATPENLQVFGLEPEPKYRFRFRMLDSDERVYEAALAIGDANPDNVAYYVYVPAAPEADQRVYLIPKQLVDFILNMLTDPIQIAPTPSSADNEADSEVATPVP
ncbi:MAG: DUF4340 domain-containing protein [Anaerolineae bacterium]|nr:DUF4340 domain-containing protein [Anaerolineae bacterium]